LEVLSLFDGDFNLPEINAYQRERKVEPRHFRASAYISGSQTHLVAALPDNDLPQLRHRLCNSLIAQATATALFDGRMRVFRDHKRRGIMRRLEQSLREGKAGWVILWLLGVPIPVLLALFLIRGCT
jgi:hypothetical protein